MLSMQCCRAIAGTIILSFGLAISALAQQDTLVLKDEHQVSLSGAVIQVFAVGKQNAVDYLITDDNGAACCVELSTLDSLIITGFGMTPVTVRPEQLLREKGVLVARVETKAIDLPEAQISAPRFSGIIVRGDTLEFKADYFADGRERSLRDLIEQMPGLEVSQDGHVTYQGQAFDRILIDGQDVVRNQFDFLNDLVLPADLLNAQVILGRDATGHKVITLNLNSKSKATWRLGLDAALTARAEPVTEANMLRINPGGWQFYTRGSYAANGEQLGGEASGIRELDFDIESLKKRISLSHVASALGLALMDNDFTSRRTASGELNLVRSAASGSTKAYLLATSDRLSTSSTEDITSVVAARPLGSRIIAGQQRLPRIFTSVSQTYQLGDRLHVTAYASGDSRLPWEQEVGRSSVGSAVGNFSYADQTSKLRSYGIVNAILRMTDSISLEATTQLWWNKSKAKFSLSDDEPIFAPHIDSSQMKFERELDFSRRFTTMQQDFRVNIRAGAFSWAPLLQMEARNWRETQNDHPNQEFITLTPLQQQHRAYATALAMRYARGAIRLNSTAGMQHLAGGRLDGLRQNLWAPLLTGDVEWRLPKQFRLGFSGQVKTVAFAEDDYWQTVEPRSTRELLGGFGGSLRFSKQASATLNLRQVQVGNGNFLVADISASINQYAVQRRLFGQSQFLFEEIVLAEDVWSWRGLLIYRRKLNKVNRINIQASQLLSQYRVPQLHGLFTDIVSERALLSANLRSQWLVWLRTRAGVEYSRIRQRSSAAAMLPTLNVWRPSLAIELRGKRLTFEPEAQLQLNRRTNGLAILNFELIYQTIRPGLQLYVIGRDLANYRQSTFRLLATSPDTGEGGDICAAAGDMCRWVCGISLGSRRKYFEVSKAISRGQDGEANLF